MPRSLAIRAIPRWSPADEPNVCFAFDEVSFEGDVWVPDWASMPPALACSDCVQRVSLGDRQATAVFPNDAQPLLAGTLEFAVQTIDCARATEASLPRYPQTPAAFDVQWLVDEAAITSPTFTVVVGIDESTGYDPESARIAAALDAAAQRFANAGITMEVQGVRALSSGVPEIYFGPGLMSTMNGLFAGWIGELVQDADGLVLPVFVVPCLVRVSGSTGSTRQDVFAGYTPRIPGGLSTGDSADGVWLAVNDCPEAGPNLGAELAADEPELFGRLIAHELGHALGLYHSDQSFGEHVVDDFETNIMRSSIVFDNDDPSLRFDPYQVTVMRQHPYIQSGD
jgi:hypothetical protein